MGGISLSSGCEHAFHKSCQHTYSNVWLKDKDGQRNKSHVGNTFGYKFASQIEAKWFSLNGSSLGVIATPENHQSRGSDRRANISL